MGVPGGDDPMLSYQSTSFHDTVSLRQLLHPRPLPEFERGGWHQIEAMRPAPASAGAGRIASNSVA